MIIDANNLVLGRLAAHAAKKALLGEKLDIINCEKSVITGDKYEVLEAYDIKLKMGIHAKGPFTPRTPDRLVKKTIRGMLPYKRERGKIAYKNIKCYIGIPDNLKSQKAETIKDANVEKLPNLDYIKVKDVCIHIGYKSK